MKNCYQVYNLLVRCRDTERKKLLSLFVTLVVMIVFWIFFPPRFTETTDDMLMACFSYGYMGEYNAKLVYINSILGYVLKIGMIILPWFPWYSFVQCTTIYASMSVLVYLILQKFGEKRAIFPIGIMYVFFGYEFFCSLQFTKTAAIAAIAGVLLMFYAVTERRSKFTYLGAALLIIMAGLFRMRGLELSLVFLLGVGLIIIWDKLKARDWKEIVRIAIPFILVLVCCYVFKYIDLAGYNTSEVWKDYWENNATRDTLQNSFYVGEKSRWPDYTEHKELYTSLGITENDLALYKSANFYDTELFTLDVMNELVEAKGGNTFNLEFFSAFVEIIGEGVLKYRVLPAVGIAFIGVLLSLEESKRKRQFLLIYEFVTFIALELYLFHRGRYLQSRVDISILFAITMIFILYGWSKNCAWLQTKRKVAVALVMLLICTSLPYYQEQYEVDKLELEDSAAYNQIRATISEDKEHFYLYYTSFSNFPDVMYDIWDVGEKGCGENCSSLGAWRSQTPIVQAKLAKYGITNPYRDMIDNEYVRFLCSNDTELKQVLTHIKEHYYTNAEAVKIDVIGHLNVYKIVTK